MQLTQVRMKAISNSFLRYVMLLELRRSHHDAGRKIFNRRWKDWARLLIERYMRLVRRAVALALVLIHPRRLSQALQERRTVVFSGFDRQVPLVTRSILRETISRERVTCLPAGKFELPLERNSSPGCSLPAAQVHRLIQVVKDRPQVFPAKQLVLFHAQTRTLVALRPYEQIFQRFGRADVFTRVHRRIEVVPEAVQTDAQRVVRFTQRVEEKIAGAAAMTIRRPAVLVARRPAESELTPESSLPAAHAMRPTGPASSVRDTPQPAPLNIELLADQVLQVIDRRLTAWRERMGKI